MWICFGVSAAPLMAKPPFVFLRVTLAQQDDSSKINEHYFVTGMVMEIGHDLQFAFA